MTEREIDTLVVNARTHLKSLEVRDVVADLRFEKGLIDPGQYETDTVRVRVERDRLIESLAETIVAKGIRRWMGCAEEALNYMALLGEVPEPFAQRFFKVIKVIQDPSAN